MACDLDIKNKTSDLISKNSNLIEEISKVNQNIIELRENILKLSESKYEEEVLIPNEIIKEEPGKIDGFEYEVKKYLNLLDKVTEGEYLLENIIEVLPFDEDYDIKRLLQRLVAEYYKKINELKIFLREEYISGIPKEELDLFDDELTLYEEKATIIKQLFINETDKFIEEEIKENNKLIFVKNSNGRIRVFEDIDDADTSYYEGFKSLLNSIIDGSFKSVKKFTTVHKKINDIFEVRDISSKTRVFFDRIADNYYVIIGAIIKKENYSHLYSVKMVNNITWYKQNKNNYIESLKSEDFLKENEILTKELFRCLDQKESVKCLVKKDE